MTRSFVIGCAAVLFGATALAQDATAPVTIEQTGKVAIQGSAIVVDPDGTVTLGGGARIRIQPDGTIEILTRDGQQSLVVRQGGQISAGLPRSLSLNADGNSASLGAVTQGPGKDKMAIQTRENGEIEIGRREGEGSNSYGVLHITKDGEKVRVGSPMEANAGLTARKGLTVEGELTANQNLNVKGDLTVEQSDGKSYPLMIGIISKNYMGPPMPPTENPCQASGAGYCDNLNNPKCRGDSEPQLVNEQVGGMNKISWQFETYVCYSSPLPE